MKLICISSLLVLSSFLSTAVGAAPTSRTKNSALVAKSETDLRLNLFLPGAQMRYQDTAAQSQELVTHYVYTVSGQVNKFLLGFEFLTSEEASGNESFEIERRFSEQSLFFGYTAFKKDFFVSGQYLLEFMLTPEVILGQSSSRVDTRVLGNSNAEATTSETTYGMGLLGGFRTGYLLVEADFRYQTSKNYEPGSLMLGTVRIGANLQF